MTQAFFSVLFLASLLNLTPQTYALPESFNIHQGSMDYQETNSKNYQVYHETAAAAEGALIAESLEITKPLLEKWLGIKRTTPQTVISNTQTRGPSFANFIYDNIELQTRGEGSRSLFWHEQVHSLMYLHFWNLLGPPGSIASLIWIPSWFIEGLAEALSVSVGSGTQTAIERYHALTNTWPSYDRLHSLYTDGDFAEQGYAVSGAFVSWLLRLGYEKEPEFLPKFLQLIRHNTLPPLYFMPFEAALTTIFGKNGRELYTQYQEEARKQWQTHKRGLLLASNPGEYHALEIRPGFVKYQDKTLLRAGGREMHFGPNGWLQKLGEKLVPYPDAPLGSWDFEGKHYVLRDIDPRSGLAQDYLSNGEKSGGKILNLAKGYYLKRTHGQSSLCRIGGDCLLQSDLPESLGWLGNTGEVIWLRQSRSLLSGEVHQLVLWDSSTGTVAKKWGEFGAKPLGVAGDGADGAWVLFEERNRFALVRYRGENCVGVYELEDYPVSLAADGEGGLFLGLYQGRKFGVLHLRKTQLQQSTCRPLQTLTSPITLALGGGGQDLQTVLEKSSAWNITQIKNMDRAEHGGVKLATQPASWSPQTVLAVPWIGGDDPLGLQFGVISIPLSDGRQNETFRLSFLLGLESRFPNTEISWESNRFWPDLRLSLYKRQVWDGPCLENNRRRHRYLDDTGVRFKGTWPWYLWKQRFKARLGLRLAKLQRYIGKCGPEGLLAEPSLGLSYYRSLGKWAVSGVIRGTLGRGAFAYNILSISGTLGRNFNFLESKYKLGIEFRRTRGKKQMGLQESYQPLKTFVAGSGGGYNKNSLPLNGLGKLFGLSYGDTKLRLKTSWTFPLIADISKNVWLFYLRSLHFNSFLNYGGAWYYNTQNMRDRMLTAYGTSLDLLFENKGVHFNASLGSGRVLGDSLRLYLMFGFDAFF